LRIALYSHDTVGLGHIRRNLLIARTLVSSSFSSSVLLVSGTREASAFVFPPGADCLTLPALYKEAEANYQPRCLEVSVAELVALRSKTIAATLTAFAPDVFIVDKVPCGVLGELKLALEVLSSQGRTRCILGLRDVLDDPLAVRREWADGANEDAIRDYYDAVWIYGDRKVYDQVQEYDFPRAVADKISYSGYLTRPIRTQFSEIDALELLSARGQPTDRLIVCMVGGGQDGVQLASAFAAIPFDEGTTGVIVTGPYMPVEVQERLMRLGFGNPRLRVLKFVTDPDLLLSKADRVIAMGGYNTVCDLLSLGKPALIVPRVHPRREQLIRAQRFQNLGMIEMVHPDHLTSGRLAAWLDLKRDPLKLIHERVDMNGVANLPHLLGEMINRRSPYMASEAIQRSKQHALR
jgi:predicted glycosyltransferase